METVSVWFHNIVSVSAATELSLILKMINIEILCCTHFTTIENNVICQKTLTGML